MFAVLDRFFNGEITDLSDIDSEVLKKKSEENRLKGIALAEEMCR